MVTPSNDFNQEIQKLKSENEKLKKQVRFLGIFAVIVLIIQLYNTFAP